MSKNKHAQSACALCFEDIRESLGFVEALYGEEYLCHSCREAMGYHHVVLKVGSLRVHALHEYSDTVRTCIIRYKDLKDVYLAPIFLSKFKWRCFFLYSDYWLVYVPSTLGSKIARGFDHVALMGAVLGLPILHDVFENNAIQKQKEKSKSQRQRVHESITLIDSQRIQGKKLLLVDDVMTTGSSMLACFSLLKPYAKRVEGLVCAYVPTSL